MFISVPYPRRSRPKRREASLSRSKLIIKIVSLPRCVNYTQVIHVKNAVQKMLITAFCSNERIFSHQFQ